MVRSPEALRGKLLAITERLRTPTCRLASSSTLWRLCLCAVVVSLIFVAHAGTATAATGCKSDGYACTIDGYNATTMTSNWAAKYYGSDTKGGIGTPPHNCTLFAAWMLAHNGLPDPGHSWGYGDQWGFTLAAETNKTPAVGAIAWYAGGAMGHVAYVARINWTNHTVFLVSDDYAPDSAGYTANEWAPFTEPTGYIHLRDLSPRLPLAAHRIKRRL
jgi:surface antigen